MALLHKHILDYGDPFYAARTIIVYRIVTLKQSILGRPIPKLIVKWLLASCTLIFVKIYHVGLNTLHAPFELREPTLYTNVA